MQKLTLFFFLFLGSFIQVTAQAEWPFYTSIREFKKQDSLSSPEKGGILFVGSSSIRRWDDLKKRFAGYPIIQRGFGGSEYKDILHYADDIIFPYQPSALFLYAGENDFGKGRTVEEVYRTFLELYSKIRKKLPQSVVYFISVKPSGKMKKHLQSIVALNDKVKKLTITESSHLHYIDIYHSMLNEKGEPKPELFAADQIHLTAQGYDLWEKAIRSQSLVFTHQAQKAKKSTLQIPPFQEKAERVPQYPLKTKRMIFKDEDLAIARSNIERYPKARQVKEGLIKAADQWLSWKDEMLRSLLTSARVPRAFDLNARGCPVHGSEVFKKGGHYPWIIDIAHPFKVKCPVGGETYPSNDYESYYKSGFKDKKGWDTQYVDDGWGWVAPDGERYWFVAYANHWLWHRDIRQGILDLSRAYLLTRDKRYAHKAAVMLYRLAQVYPEMDYANQSRYGLMMKAENSVYNGKVVNAIWETGFTQDAVEAYDGIWDSIDEDTELQKLYGKSGKDIRGFIEANLLEEALDAYFEGKIEGNFGMHQTTLLYILLARQNMDTKKYIHLLVDEPGHDRDHTGLRYALYNQIFRDGLALESPGYNMIWVDRLAVLSELLAKGGVDLYNDPRLKMLFDGPLNIVATGKYTVDWGDTGSPLGGVVGRSTDTYEVAYDAYHDPRYLNWLASIGQTGENSFSSFGSLFRKTLPKTPALADGRAVEKQASRLFAGYGLGILNNKADKTAIAFTYGMHLSHYHWDFLNIELFANGQKMMPDLGYPDAMNAYVPELYTWSTNTINHNTVVVDAKKQNQNRPGIIHDFSEGKFARTMDASSPAYTQTTQYRRNIVMVDVEDNQSYAVDFFRVTGGKQHDYSLHGPPGTVNTLEGIWGKEQEGTLAGQDVAVGQIYDNAKLGAEGYNGGYGSYSGSGFQYLFNVQRLESGQGLLQYKHVRDDNARLRIHLLPQEAQEVCMADAFDKPRAKTHLIKYLIARRKAGNDNKELKSTFISVLEPFNTTAYIQSTKLLSFAGGDGNAVEVVRKGVKDIIISDTQNSPKKLGQYPIETDANSAVVTLDDHGNLKRVFFSNGTYLVYKGRRFKAEPLSGVVTEVNTKTREINIKIENSKGGMIMGATGGIAHFTNPYHSLVHPFSQITKTGNQIKMTVKDDLLSGIARIKDANEKAATTATTLPFSALYNGAAMLNSELKPITTIEKVQNGMITFAGKPAVSLKTGDDVWFSTVGVGDRMEVKPVLSWIAK